MGIFHYRCGVTGLSLNGAECVAIWVCETEPGRWVPATLPIRGIYNGYGTIDMLYRFDDQSWHIDRLRKWFKLGYETDRIRVGGDSKLELERRGLDGYGLEGPLGVVERATTCEHGMATFGGMKLAQRLIHAAIFDAVVAAHPQTDVVEIKHVVPCPAGAWFYQSIHDGEKEPARAAFAAMQAFGDWFTEWLPERDPGQLGVPDLIDGYLAARTKFAETPWMIQAIDQLIATYEREYQPELPNRWLRDWGASWYGAVVGSYRVVATSRAELARAFDHELSIVTEEELLSGRFEAFAVVSGTPLPAIDLRSSITVTNGSATARLDDPTLEDMLTMPGGSPEPTVDPAALAALPDLPAPLQQVGTEALYLAGASPPSWIEDYEHEWVFAFERYGDHS